MNPPARLFSVQIVWRQFRKDGTPQQEADYKSKRVEIQVLAETEGDAKANALHFAHQLRSQGKAFTPAPGCDLDTRTFTIPASLPLLITPSVANAIRLHATKTDKGITC